jgi:hypothetical protein
MVRKSTTFEDGNAGLNFMCPIGPVLEKGITAGDL